MGTSQNPTHSEQSSAMRILNYSASSCAELNGPLLLVARMLSRQQGGCLKEIVRETGTSISESRKMILRLLNLGGEIEAVVDHKTNRSTFYLRQISIQQSSGPDAALPVKRLVSGEWADGCSLGKRNSTTQTTSNSMVKKC